MMNIFALLGEEIGEKNGNYSSLYGHRLQAKCLIFLNMRFESSFFRYF